MKRLLAAALAAAFQAATLGAPFVHAHPDDHATAHHDGRAVHAHWGSHAPARDVSGAPAVGNVDHDRAVFFNASLAGVAAVAAPQPGLMPAVIAMPVPAERPAHVTVEVSHGHDPPARGSLPSRAPPRLSLLI